MRSRWQRLFATALVPFLLFLAACSSGHDWDPIVGEWKADGPQPKGLFGIYNDPANIEITPAGEARIGDGGGISCMGGKVIVDKSGGDTHYRLEFTGSGCTTFTPPKLDLVVKDGKLEIQGSGSVPGVYRLRRR